MKVFIYRFLQCTWGILQTLCGSVLYLINRKEKHFSYKGAIVSEWNYKSSVSLGMFIFLSKKRMFIPKYSQKELLERLLVHEYGHTIQSLILGPFYLFIIGLPSMIWCCVPRMETYRKEKNRSYYSLYTEKWANYCGEKVTKKKSMETIDRRRT